MNSLISRLEEIRGEYFYVNHEEIKELLNHDFNRKLRINHVNRIAKNLKLDCQYFTQDILVGYKNGKLVLADGHHRKQAMLDLAEKGITVDSKGNPIKLRVHILPAHLDIEKVMLEVNNTSLSWTIQDFIELNAHKGNESCVNFLNFMDYNHIEKVSVALAYLGKSSLSKAQAEQFDRFPLCTEQNIKTAQIMYEAIQTIQSSCVGSLIKSFDFSTNGIRYFVKFCLERFTGEEFLNFIQWLCSKKHFQVYEDHFNKRGTAKYWDGFYEHLINMYNE